MKGDGKIDREELIHQLDTLWFLRGHRGERWVRVKDVEDLINSEKVKIKDEQAEVGKWRVYAKVKDEITL